MKNKNKKEKNTKETNNTSNLKILRVQDPKDFKVKPLHENLPQLPALVLMISPVKTGKSTIISNLLLNESFYGPDFFENVHIISNTINNDLTSRFLAERFDVEDNYNDEMIVNLLETQKSYEKKDQPESMLSQADWPKLPYEVDFCKRVFPTNNCQKSGRFMIGSFSLCWTMIFTEMSQKCS